MKQASLRGGDDHWAVILAIHEDCKVQLAGDGDALVDEDLCYKLA